MMPNVRTANFTALMTFFKKMKCIFSMKTELRLMLQTLENKIKKMGNTKEDRRAKQYRIIELENRTIQNRKESMTYRTTREDVFSFSLNNAILRQVTLH